MKSKNRAEIFDNKIHSLQRDLYNYASKIEDKAEKCKNNAEKNILLKIAQHINNAAFEMDNCQREMLSASELLKTK